MAKNIIGHKKLDSMLDNNVVSDELVLSDWGG